MFLLFIVVMTPCLTSPTYYYKVYCQSTDRGYVSWEWWKPWSSNSSSFHFRYEDAMQCLNDVL